MEGARERISRLTPSSKEPVKVELCSRPTPNISARKKSINQYGISKRLGEELLRKSGVKYSIARSSVIYGWGRRNRTNFATCVLDKLRSNLTVSAVKDHVVSPTLNSNLADLFLDLAERRTDGVLHLAIQPC